LLGVPFRYPDDLSSQSDILGMDPTVTGGTYELKVEPYTDRTGILRVGTTGRIPFNATAAVVQGQLEILVGVGNVSVVAQPAVGYIVTFQKASTGLAIDLEVTSSNLSGANPVASISVFTEGGIPFADPQEITSTPNGFTALSGNNARVRVIVAGG